MQHTPQPSVPTTPTKQSPAKSIKKLTKKIRNQFHRLSSSHNHVTPRRTVFDEAFPIITSISTSPLFHPSQTRQRTASAPLLSLRPPSTETSYSVQSFVHEKAGRHSQGSTSQESLDYPSQSMHSADSVLDASTGTEPDSTATVVHVEPEAPDPFLVDDELESSPVVSTTPISQDVHTNSSVLGSEPEPITPHSFALLSTNVNKAVPPPPVDNESDDNEGVLDLYLPGLLMPSLFLPIPNTDPLSILLTKYISTPEKRPVRDVTGDWQRTDIHTLVMTNSWRALARMARDRLVTSNPGDISLILDLWYLRLACLARLRFFNQAATECTNLFVTLNAIEPSTTREWLFDCILPFELEVIHARIKYWSGDHMGHLDALSALLRRCKARARKEEPGSVNASMWKERGTRVCLIIASQFVEIKDYTAATKLLEPLCQQDSNSTAELRSAVGRIYLQSGQMQAATMQFKLVEADPSANQELKDMNAALLACVDGNWAHASSLLENIIEGDANNYVAANNLAVALLGQGKLKKGTRVLETALKTSPSSVVVAEPFLFNLSTLYELRSTTSVENKQTLLIEVAKLSGDGLRASCLKMPTT